jgi:hypothetical protein
MSRAIFAAIVERTLVLHDHETGERREIRLAIGQPYWTEPGLEAACPVAIHGYLGRLADIRGIDPLSALTLAIRFLESLLEGLPETRTVHWPSGEGYFQID